MVTRSREKLFLRCLGGMLERLDSRQFEPVIVCNPERAGMLREGLHSTSIGVVPLPARLDQVVATVREARFDVLYFWEIGTDTTNYLLPFFRTAPVQCTSFGIAVTSGIPAVDYYLSSALVEGADAAEHYSEKLLLADTLLPYQQRLALPQAAKQREDFGLRPQQHVYACAQQLGKFHPDFDALLAEILRRDARAVVVVTEKRFGGEQRQLQQRFAAAMPDVCDRIVFVPYQPTEGYLSLVATADVLLDPLHFGAGTSAYDGFSLGKPTVTWPSAFQRGRFVLGCYRKMGLAGCVAANARQYVEMALALGTDAAYRAKNERRNPPGQPGAVRGLPKRARARAALSDAGRSRAARRMKR